MTKNTFAAKIFLLLCTLVSVPMLGISQTIAAGTSDTLWTTGKIFVVLIVAGLIFGGIGIFLLLLERKISKLEKTIAEKNL